MRLPLTSKLDQWDARDGRKETEEKHPLNRRGDRSMPDLELGLVLARQCGLPSIFQ
jgi:hypothetical protein